MLEITEELSIDESELELRFVRSSGPGGQHVNKVATAVQLRFDVRGSSLPEPVQKRLIELAGRRISGDGVLIIEAAAERSQKRNREEAIDRLVELVKRAAKKPKARRATRPTKASERARLEEKKRRAAIKRGRSRVPSED